MRWQSQRLGTGGAAHPRKQRHAKQHGQDSHSVFSAPRSASNCSVATVRPFATHGPRGSVVARLGALRLAAGEAADPGTTEPCYVRAPEAELSRGASR